MTGRERRTLTALHTLHQFCIVTLPTLLPDLPPQFTTTIARLGTTLADLKSLELARFSNSTFKAASNHRDHLVHRIRTELLHPMRRIATFSGIASDTTVSFTVPRPRTAMATIIDCARAYAAAAEPHRETFVELGMDPDFLDQLRTLTDTLAAEANTAASSRVRGVQDARTFRAQLKEARRLAWLLDSILRRYCAHVINTRTTSTDPDRLGKIQSALAGWTTSFHIERDPVRRARRLRPTL